MLVAAAGACVTSCDDWTEPESVDLNYNGTEQAPNYQAYLESLRAYRASDHKKVYAWVSLPNGNPTSQGERVTALPDSVDVVVIESPEYIHPSLIADIKKAKADKAMEVIYCIDYDALKAEYTVYCEELAAKRALIEPNEDGEVIIPDELLDPDFYDWIFEQLTAKLQLAKNSEFTGVMFAFNGKATLHMTEAELAEYNKNILVFMNVASDWHKRNPQLTYDFLGYPQNITNRALLDEYRVLFCRQGLDAADQYSYTQYLQMAAVDGVPAEKLGMMTSYISLDETDVTTGVFNDGSLAIDCIGSWAANQEVAAVGVKNANNDYYNGGAASYAHLRNMIQKVNPSIN